jgi:transposase
MAGSLHGSARTTPRVRAELQASQEKTSTLAQHYGLSRTTVSKWRSRTTTDDAAMGPRSPRSTVLSLAEEAMVVEFRRRTLLPLDDVLGSLRDTIPKLTRSSLHRCLERHGISRLPEDPNKTPKRGKFAQTAIGYVHIDISELRLAEGKLNMFLAIDRVSKFTYVEFRDDAGKANGADLSPFFPPVRSSVRGCRHADRDGVSRFGRAPFLRPGHTPERRRAQPGSRLAAGHRAGDAQRA